MPSSNQCAVGTDGNLLDESETIWYNDAEDLVPIAPAASQVPSTSSALKATTHHPFFNGGSTPRPAVSVAGAHRSSCVSKPSKCILDVNNAELQAESKSSKRARIAHKAVQSESEDESSKRAHIAHKAVQSESEDEASITHASDDVGGDTDVEMEDSDPIIAEDTYALTKAMGDQDCKVSAYRCHQ